MAKIVIQNLDFAYNGSLVLKNINHSFLTGNLISLVGPNGSGKSTLLKCLNQILKPKKGTIKIDDKSLYSFSSSAIAQKMAYVPQSEGNIFPATVFDTVLLGRKPFINWSPTRHDLEIVNQKLEQLNLSEIALKPINKLSGGQRQRTFIARALAQQPEVLLLDEPTANLDLKHQIEVLKILKELSSQGITVIVAIHDLNLALQFSNKFVLLKDGEIFVSGGKEVISNKNIETLYETKVKILEESGQFIIVPQIN